MCENAPKMGPPNPPDPPKLIFWVGGMCSNLPRPKPPITLLYRANQRCFVHIFPQIWAKMCEKTPPGGPWTPLTPPNPQKLHCP